MRLKQMKTTDFSEEEKYDFLIPIGATEQHGPFLPTGVDTYITDYLVDRAEEVFSDLIILPILEYSKSQEHRGFMGTIWLTKQTLANVLYDAVNSLRNMARTVTFLTFHANERVIDKFISENQNTFSHIRLGRVEIWHDEDDRKLEKLVGGEIDEHAGNTEISCMLAIQDDLVDIPTPAHVKQTIINPFETDNLADKSKDGIADNNPNWVVSREIGEKVLGIYSKRVIAELEAILE